MSTQEWSSSALNLGHTLFDGLPVPVCLVDMAGHLLALNRRALGFWQVPPGALLGRAAMRTLGIAPADGRGDAWKRLTTPGSRPRLACRITTADGRTRLVSILYTALRGGDEPLAALFIMERQAADAFTDVPEWALRDPVTSLGNRNLWQRESAMWAERAGCAVFFDLDDLKEVNDLYGHVAGDRLLAATGQALAAISPPAALAVRFGGDEFLVLLPDPDEAAAEAWAQTAVDHVAACGLSAALPLVPRLQHGVAPFGPGGLRAAVQRADTLLYQRKGILLQAAGGGRIILTREGRTGVHGPGGDDQSEAFPGVFSTAFGPEFAGYVRASFAHATAQARDFVAFVAPAPGEAVIEVGAGNGRIAFDGGLAERVGPTGQLLVTDPSWPQLQKARQRAAELGLDWVRFLRAPAEELPLASGTADLVVGSTFLHFTEPERALREMARALRPNGRLALQQPLAFPWPALWWQMAEPLRTAAAAAGVALQPLFPSLEALHHQLAVTGLEMERVRVVGPDPVDFPDGEIAVAYTRQMAAVAMLLRALSVERRAAAQADFEARIRQEFDRARPEERRLASHSAEIVARKPG